MFDKMKQLMEFKKQADKIKKDIEAIDLTVEEVSGIKIVISGAQKVKSIEVGEDRIGSGKASLEQDLLKSVNAAIQRSQAAAAEKMKSVMPMGGLPSI